VQTPTLVLPLEPTIPPVKVAPPKRTTPPAQPAFTAPPYRRGMLGRLIPKIGRIIHAGLVKQAREVHAQAVVVWKLRCEEIGRENDAEQRAYEQRLRSHHPLVVLHQEMLEEHRQKVSAARASFDVRKADWETKQARFEQAKDDDLVMLAAVAEASARGHAESKAELVRLPRVALSSRSATQLHSAHRFSG